MGRSKAIFKAELEEDKSFDGQIVEVLEVMAYDKFISLVGPIYKVLFEDGHEAEVFETSLSFICSEQPYAIFVDGSMFTMFGRPLVWFNREPVEGFLKFQFRDEPSARIVELNIDDIPEDACIMNTVLCRDERAEVFVLRNV